MNQNAALRHLTTLTLSLALFVVMLGAYTRLTDAGLGCPDWPGCYGHLIVPQNLQTTQAWTEMIHRYLAGTLGILILLIVFMSSQLRSTDQTSSSILPWLLLILVAGQATLGMWTVTCKLLPVVVMSHLLGGFFIFATLCYYRWHLSATTPQPHAFWRVLLNLGIALLLCQIALGGWVSSNYAGIACIGFPQCNGAWIPTLDITHAFNVVLSSNINHQGGLLDNTARVTIQWFHRLGALVTASYLLLLGMALVIHFKSPLVRRLVSLVIGLVVVQCLLGVVNVIYLLPLWAAVLHNGVAATLLGSLFSLHYYLSSPGEK
jgi:cytochrome c oxidase assembly protein subunit 15